MLTVRGGGYMTEFNIDGDGDMYSCRYDESQDDRFGFNSDGRYTSDELSDKFNHSQEFVMTVETLEFNEMVDTTPVAASGTVSDTEFIEADGGVWNYKIYTFNNALGAFQEHVLLQEDDTYFFNTHPATINLSVWLKAQRDYWHSTLQKQ